MPQTRPILGMVYSIPLPQLTPQQTTDRETADGLATAKTRT